MPLQRSVQAPASRACSGHGRCSSSPRCAAELRAHRAAARASGCPGRLLARVGQQGAQQATAEQLKLDIQRAVANTDRGRGTTPQQRRDILALIEALEALNPTQQPALSGLLSGNWSLLYQVPLKEEDAARQTPNTTLEGPVLARLRPLRGPFRTKSVTQLINLERGRVENALRFAGPAGLTGCLNIRGTCAPTFPEADAARERVDVRFCDFQLALGPLKATVPLGWANPNGWVRTTYLDADVRVGRGDKGSIFFVARQK